MDFSYSEEHEDIRSLVSEILGDFSSAERLKKLETDGAYFDKEVWQKLIETGIHSASFPTTFDGMGMDYSATTLVVEAIGRSMVSIPYIPCIISTALPLIPAIKNKTVLEELQNIIKGESLAVAALIEPGNEDSYRPSVLAKQEEDEWTINGIKHCVPYAGDANTLLVNANVGGNLWLGLINSDQSGVKIIEQQCTASELQYQVTFNQAKARCIAQGEEAKNIIQQSIAMTTVAYCAMAVGVADKMTRISGEYTSERKQFGVAIATFQAVAHRLADCYIDTECLKIITLKAASDVSQGNYETDVISMAKVWCGDVLARVSQAAQHVHGGMGIDRDYHLFRFCLWSKQLELSLGNSKIHMARLADRIEQRYLSSK